MIYSILHKSKGISHLSIYCDKFVLLVHIFETSIGYVQRNNSNPDHLNEPVLTIKEVMSKLEKERRENEKKKMSEHKWKIARKEAERLEAQKKQ